MKRKVLPKRRLKAFAADRAKAGNEAGSARKATRITQEF